MGTVNPGMFTSATYEWPTPDDLYTTLDREFHFTLDPCATADNAKTERYFTKETDGLAQEWTGRAFMNPPYGRQIGHWVAKAYTESRHWDATVVCLIPARTDTAYWHDYVMHAAEIRFIHKRLNFDNDRQAARVTTGESKAHNAPFPSVVVVFRPGYEGPPTVSAISRDGNPLSTRRLRPAQVPFEFEEGGAA